MEELVINLGGFDRGHVLKWWLLFNVIMLDAGFPGGLEDGLVINATAAELGWLGLIWVPRTTVGGPALNALRCNSRMRFGYFLRYATGS